MPRLKKPTLKETILVRSHTLTPTTDRALREMSQDASDYIGWTVSNSAVVRALVRYATAQGELWQREHLYPSIEQEIQDGTFWGKRSELVTQVKGGPMELLMLGLVLVNSLYLVWASLRSRQESRLLMEAFRDIEATASRTERMTARMLTMVGELEEKAQ